ncbi:sugar ABC transporter ATP-binding protein [Ammoniphilus sp. YIM 78166]|uniref:sugar ABC transporter ATP-binding protein n=1 Tax=Ammoniphilus sp. YIM 78166 TaxID=1644106 RepID=UPI00106F89FA|nr:sugar ABC transporter ATP-binding protein [Ammoniphilus sp. YIM 78166]
MAKLEMKQIQKSFSGVPALRGVDFELRAGEIHALLGANGAGKSTLMKILTGAYTSDEGDILVDGSKVEIATPADAKKYGIQCVYQEVDVALVPYLSVAENIMLDRQVNRKGSFFKWSSLYRDAEGILARLGFKIPVRKKAEELTLSEKQIVLIARAIAQDVKYVIFDEPTAPLSVKEADQLFALMQQLKKQQVGMIFISHRLPEIFQVCDRITVMRDGQHVLTKAKGDTSINQVIADMLGRSFSEEFPKKHVPVGDTLFEVRGIKSGKKVRGVDLHIREGEIVAVAGLVGAGKTELARVLFGADPRDEGEMILRGKSLSIHQPTDAVREGVVLVPEERRKEGILVEESVRNNLTLASLRQFTSFGFVRQSSEAAKSGLLVDRLGIKTPSIHQLVGNLSGGNQQKVVIGKWLDTDAQVFMFDEPTKGVDIGAKTDIFKLIGELAEQRKGILYLSSELQEILGIADRILVMCDGQIVKELTREKATQENIMYYASGGK